MYTYLIGWSKHDKWYYGVRYARDCRPGELWKTYFTSSKYVHEFKKLHGDPDVIEIRKTFTDKSKAQKWEHGVLRRLGVTKSDRWLNQTDNVSIHYHAKRNNWKVGLEAARLKNIGRKKSKKELMALGEASKKRWANPEIRKKMSVKKPDNKYKEGAMKRWAKMDRKAFAEKISKSWEVRRSKRSD